MYLSFAYSFGQMQVVPRLKRFLDSYPDIKIDLTATDRFIDLVEEGIDVAIGIEDYEPPPLPIQAVYRRGRFQAAKIRCFIDFLEQEFKLESWVSNSKQSG